MNIVINGGTKGIGRETVKTFSVNPANIIIVTGRNKQALEKVCSEAENANVFGQQFDLEAFDRYSGSFLQVVQKKLGSIDILINTAGSLTKEEFIDFSIDAARKMMEINFWGIASMIRLLKPVMKKGSHIVNISSMGGYQGSTKFKGMSFYSASKAALSCLSECLAVEFRDAGIIVNCLALGSVQTEMFEEAFPGYTANVNSADMAGFITDFAVNGSKFFNGKVLPVALNTP